MTKHMRVGLIQMRCEKGAIAENLADVGRTYAQAVARRVDIVGFPEMSITGYADPTRYPEAILRLDGPEVPAHCSSIDQTPANNRS